jgi:hypothetical protein
MKKCSNKYSKIGAKYGYVMPDASTSESMADSARPLYKGFFVLDRKPWTAKNNNAVKSNIKIHFGAR